MSIDSIRPIQVKVINVQYLGQIDPEAEMSKRLFEWLWWEFEP